MDRPPSAELPDRPGAYLFRDQHGQVLYAGKAKSLRKRVLSYFNRDIALRTRTMVEAADTVETIVTENEVEALMLEYSLIQRHRPRFNIRLRDDKSYPFLAITRRDDWPAARVMRGKRRRGTQYFGPYAHAYAIRNTLDLLLKTFPIRTCSTAKFNDHAARGRPCLLFDIEKCSGPCVGEISSEKYLEHVDGLAAFLNGETSAVVEDLKGRMQDASNEQAYELAARYRDRLRDVEKAMERQEVATTRPENFDLVAVVDDQLEAAAAVLTIRRGRVVGRFTTIIDKVEDVDEAGLVERLLRELYGSQEPPRSVLVGALPDDPEIWEAWLQERRGGPVSVRVPQRGPKRRLMETAVVNAREAFARHRLRRQSDPNARARALRSLQDELALPTPPLRIEAFDISTIQGRHTVASMVVLEDGLPRRSDYRRFRIKTVHGQDDFASMEEALERRFKAYLADRDRPVEERGKFAYPPSLLLIDGGAGQLGRAVAVLDRLDLDIPVIGLAKRMEEVYMPGLGEPIRIPRDSEALYILQRARDEAHRFAIDYHRKLRGKRMVDSILDDVPGIGPGRKKLLIRKFGSLKRIRAASEEELAEVVPSSVAEDLYAALHE